MIKTYELWSNAKTNWAESKTVQSDFFSTVFDVKLIYNFASLSAETIKIEVNGKKFTLKPEQTVATGGYAKGVLAGELLVTDVFQNGLENVVRLDMGYFSPAKATLSLQVSGYLADFQTVLTQNNNIANAYKVGQIDKNNFTTMRNFQNNVAQTMFANGFITGAQRQQLVDVLNVDLGSGGNGGNNGDGNGGSGNGLLDKLFGGSSGSDSGFWTPRNIAIVVVVVVLIGGAVLFALSKKGGAQP